MSTTFRELFNIPCVRRLWIGQLVSISGDFLAMFAVLSTASFRMHASAAQITGITISFMLPLTIFGPIAGVLVDRWHPQSTMVRSDLARAVLALLLVFATQLREFYAILFAISTISTFFIPAQSVAFRALVPREGLITLNASLQQAMLVTRILSPAVAGALVARFGPVPCFYLDVLSFLLSALLLGTAGFPSPPMRDRSHAGTVMADLAAGVRFVLTHPALSFVIIAMAAATFAISCSSPMLAVFVRDKLRAGSSAYAMISATIGVGMIAGTQTVRTLSRKIQPREMINLSLATIASGILLTGMSQSLAVAAAGACILGAGVGPLMAPAQTLIQAETPLPMAGRVSSGVMCLVSASQILGLTLSGTLAHAMGLRPLFFFAAFCVAGFAVLSPRKSLDKLNAVK